VCYIDLDGFKDINDRYGHGAGDRLLVEVARRLQVMVRVNDTVCRVGGDEFVLVLTYLDTELDYVGVLHRVIAEIGKPIALGYMDPNKIGEVSASIGVALYPADGRDADALIRHADQAMYQAKQRGRKQVCTYAAIRAEPPTSSAG
jgi:diguanylate cyclase (GGDEF)-like protein